MTPYHRITLFLLNVTVPHGNINPIIISYAIVQRLLGDLTQKMLLKIKVVLHYVIIIHLCS